MYINKWFFKDFRAEIRDLGYVKQIPFMSFSDLKNNDYELIGRVLDRIHYNRELLLSIGQKQAPFGATVSPDNDKELNILLNSCAYSFILNKDITENHYLLKSVLATVIPICNINNCMINKLGLKTFATQPDYENIISKLCEIKSAQHVYNRRIRLLSWKYFLQIKKWDK